VADRECLRLSAESRYAKITVASSRFAIHHARVIVPCHRLLIWTALVALPAALLAGLLPPFLPVAAAAAGVFAALVALDALLGLGALEGIQIQLPAVARFSKDRPGAIEVEVRNEKQKSRQLRLGFALPREFSAPQEDLTVQLPAGSLLSRLSWPCTPWRRGCYPLDRCHLESVSPLGFWAVRAAVPSPCELRVYPNLLLERNACAALFLNRHALGAHAQRQIGKGRDFEQLRDYIAGDGYEDIHWKATAKRGRPVTKIFQIERTQEIYVVADASRLSARLAPGGVTVLERFITAGLVLGLAAQQQGDLFGLLTFSNRIENFVRAKNGRSHYNLCRDAIYALQPRQVSPDFDELAAFIRLRLRRRALLVILTSLDDPVLAENFVRDIALVCRQHVVLVNMMQSPDIAPMFSGPDPERLDDLYRHLGAHLLWNNLRELEIQLQRLGVRFSLVRNEALSAQLITQYMTVKRRQML
jgi:uncharacterized protein (DUF58 family)